MSVAEEVKQSLDIVSIISAYTPLTKSGRNFKARCPFHTERTPSFYVFPDRQTWRCFGACATGGDVFSFVMRQENVPFGDALRSLASRAGIAIREFERAPEEEERVTRLRAAHQAAALYYHHLLLNSTEAKNAKAYVAQRGINQEAVAAFLLGYSPTQRTGLKAHLEAEGFVTEELVAAGLLLEDGAGAHDRFHGRLMFPIRDPGGAVIGFGARSLDGSNPKYLNSPQSPIFDKSATLYGLDIAREAIRQQHRAVIVEGYMDALMAHQHGFKNVVASMGTSLTEKQVTTLARLTSSIVLALDADAAGQAATLRGLQIAPDAMGEEYTAEPAAQGRVRRRQVDGRQIIYSLPRGASKIVAQRKGEIRVLELPKGKDPDELLRSDPTIWERLVAESLPMLDFLLKSVQQRYDLTTPQGKTDAVEEVLTALAELPKAQQTHYLQRLTTLVGVEERALHEELQKLGRHKSKEAPAKDVGSLNQHFQNTEILEDYCLTLLLQFDFLRPEAAGLGPEHFLSAETREIFRGWQEHPGTDLTVAVDETVQTRLQDILATPLPPITPSMAQAALAQCIHRLEERRLRDLKLHHRLRLAQEDEEQGAKEGAQKAYIRWQSLRGREAAFLPTEPPQEEVSELVQVQEMEVSVNQQLHQLMEQRHLRPTGQDSQR